MGTPQLAGKGWCLGTDLQQDEQIHQSKYWFQAAGEGRRLSWESCPSPALRLQLTLWTPQCLQLGGHEGEATFVPCFGPCFGDLNWLIWKLWKEGTWPSLGLGDHQVTAALAQRAGAAAEPVPSCPHKWTCRYRCKRQVLPYINILFSHVPLPRSPRAGQVAHPVLCSPGSVLVLAEQPRSARPRLAHGVQLLVLPHPSSPRLYEPSDCPVPREVLRGTAPSQGWQGSCSQRYTSARGSGI